jgi:hypothetical protein
MALATKFAALLLAMQTAVEGEESRARAKLDNIKPLQSRPNPSREARGRRAMRTCQKNT